MEQLVVKGVRFRWVLEGIFEIQARLDRNYDDDLVQVPVLTSLGYGLARSIWRSDSLQSSRKVVILQAPGAEYTFSIV